MKNAILAMLVMGAAALSSCEYDSYGGGPGGPPRPHYPNHPQYPGGGGGGGGAQAASAFRMGERDGARDKRFGRRYNPYSGQGSVARPFQDNYRNGYAAGFRSTPGGSGGGVGNWGGNNGGGGNWGGNNGGGGHYGNQGQYRGY